MMANFSGTWQNLGDIAEDRCCDMYWTARQCSRINWDYFGLNAVSVLLVLNIIERLLNDIGKDRYYYIGLTQDPLFRMHKISRKNCSISAHYPLKWGTLLSHLDLQQPSRTWRNVSSSSTKSDQHTVIIVLA